MNKIWLIVLISAISILMFKSPEIVLTAFSSGANKAVRFSIELCAIYAVWTGIMKIVDETGLSKVIAKLLSPIIDFLFGKDLPKEAKKYVSLNMSENILGMGGAATPMGIKAIEKMDDGKDTATPQMIMLIILATTSLQLIPTTIIGILTEHKSSNSSSIILPTLLSSIISTVIGVLLVKLCTKFSKKRGGKK